MSDKKRILIIDDEEDMVAILENQLQMEGFDTMSAYDGQEGLEKAEEERPDLILLDVMLPKMNGYQVCRLLKFNQQFKDIPVIIITARSQEKDHQLAQEVGANAYLVKPFEKNLLIQKINELITA